MIQEIQAGEIFKLVDFVPYIEGKITKTELAFNDKMKFMLMAFDGGRGLSEHTAPWDAILLALDGKATIGYEGREHEIKAGESFYFAKDVLHWLKTEGPFKMALLLVDEEK